MIHSKTPNGSGGLDLQLPYSPFLSGNSFYCRSFRLRSWPSFGLHLGCTEDHEFPEAPVSLFGYSGDNYFITMDTISQLCREEAEVDSVQESEIEWLSSTIIFLKRCLFVQIGNFELI
ncbi:hypothetical protein PVL29_010580 [Vitis rotundifolia]|uniref:Uncharacterized protein n=1 Tax=Vitis rotundifolia TaxID=103349 RepID=A0AA39DT45_VITRO|nr:hypothetical protein PVL29_010580 [Vitis rotundifolia]